MAKGRIRSRREMREQYDAAEARERTEREEGTADAAEEAASDEEEAAVKPKKKAVKKKAVGEAKPRKKATKAVERKRVVWVVYDNSNKEVARFPYTQKKEAEEKAEQMKTDKKQTYFVQPFKEVIKDATPAAPAK